MIPGSFGQFDILGIFLWWSFCTLFESWSFLGLFTSSFIFRDVLTFLSFSGKGMSQTPSSWRWSDPSSSFSGIRFDDISSLVKRSLDDSRNQISFRVLPGDSSQSPSSRRCSERSLEGSFTNSFISEVIWIFFGPGGLARIFVFILTTIERSLFADIWLQLRWLGRYGLSRFFFYCPG